MEIPLIVAAALTGILGGLIGNLDRALLGGLLPGSVPAGLVGAARPVCLPYGSRRLVPAAVLSVIGVKLRWSVA